jgi:ABC-type sugar transport system ATPase subunit
MTKEEVKKIVSHFNENGDPVLFLTIATPETIKLQEEVLTLHKEGKLKDVFNS